MMDEPNICTFTKDEMRCERPALAESDRCEKHPHDGGSAVTVTPAPTPKPPGSFDKVKNLLAIERLIELGAKALEWIEEHIPPDIFGAADQSQLNLLKQLVSEQDPNKKRELATRLSAALRPAQLLVIVALAVAASAALNQNSAGSSSDA